MTTYQREPVAGLWDEAWELLKAHWEEVAHYKDIALNPDVGLYDAMEKAGALRCYTARVDGKLVGYAVFFVRPNAHYKQCLVAQQDVLFVLPAYRLGRTGITLIRVAEKALRADGVQVVYHHAKRTNRVGELLARLGYELVDEIYAKRLD